MKILLVAGGYDSFIRKKLACHYEIANLEALYLQELHTISGKFIYDLIVFIDMDYCCTLYQKIESVRILLSFVGAQLVLFSSDQGLIGYTEDNLIQTEEMQVVSYFGHAVDDENIKNCLSLIKLKPKLVTNKNLVKSGIIEPPSLTDNKAKKTFFSRFRGISKDVIEPTDLLTKEIGKISRGISRIIGITGHRGSGITSTTVNLAFEAQKMGLSSIIIDLDVEFRSMNMYFSAFNEIASKDEVMKASLVRMLAKPYEYMSNSYCIKDDLWLTSLGYSFDDKKLIDRFFTANYIISMISLLRSKFNMIWIDLPMGILSKFPELLSHIDCFGLCVNNNLYSIISTLRNIEVSLESDHGRYLNSKAKLICTKYNHNSKFDDDFLTAEKVAKVLSSGLSEVFIYEPKVAGELFYDETYDEQIEKDIPIVNQKQNFEKMMDVVLLRLIEGA